MAHSPLSCRHSAPSGSLPTSPTKPTILHKRISNIRRFLSSFYTTVLLTALIVTAYNFSHAALRPHQPPNTAARRRHNNQQDLQWLRNQPEPAHEFKSSVCLRLGGLAAVGAIENWFWTLQEHVFNSDGLRLHAVNLKSSHWLSDSMDEFYYSKDVISKLMEANIRLNVSPEDLAEECDIVFSSWVDPPLRPPKNSPRFHSVLVIHGSDAVEKQGTWLYANYIDQYDAAICLSAECMTAYGPAADAAAVPLHLIPPSIDVSKYNPNAEMKEAREALELNTPTRKKVLGFLGQISEDTNPQLFVDVVERLPRDWRGVMAGPLYESGKMTNLSSRVTYLGHLEDPWTFLAAVDAVFMPSSNEDGIPISLLQSWAMRKPCFMRETGIIPEHAKGVFALSDDASAGTIAAHIDGLVKNNHRDAIRREITEKKLDYGMEILKKDFSIAPMQGKYLELMESLLKINPRASIARLPFMVHYPNDMKPPSETLQITRRGRTILARCFTRACIFSLKIVPFKDDLFPMNVTIVARTMSAPRPRDRKATVAAFFRAEGGDQQVGVLEADLMWQKVRLNLASDVFLVQMYPGHAVHVMDMFWEKEEGEREKRG